VVNLGYALKRARREKKLKLKEVASKFKIRPRYLIDIEDGNDSSIPSVYKIGYIRAYSKYLGVDIEEYLQDLSVESESKFSPVEESYLEQTKPPLLTVSIAVFCICLSVIVVAVYNIKPSSKDNTQINYKQTGNVAQLFINADDTYSLENIGDNKSLVAVVAKSDLKVEVHNDQGKLLESRHLNAGESFSLSMEDKLILLVDTPNALEFYEFSPITMEKRELVAITR